MTNQRKKQKILIADDEPLNIQLLMAILGNQYEYETVRDGWETFKKILDYRPDLVFLDIFMPGMSGIDICKMIKGEHSLSGTPLVLITASTDEGLKLQGLSAGASDFLTKPINLMETKIKTTNLLKLKEYHDLLETKVKQRTKELEKVCDELRATEERFTKVFHANPHIMFVISAVDQRYYMVNDEFVKTTGCNTEIVGRRIDAISLISSPCQDEIIQILIDKRSIQDMDICFKLKSTQERDGLLSAEIIDISGESHYLFIITDITERKHFEFAKELAHLDRLNLVGQMAASIGHEIRNPMTTTRGFLQYLQQKDEYVHHREYFNIMIEELDRANSIITEFLSLAKDKRVEKKPRSLQAVIEPLKNLIDANVALVGKHILYELRPCPHVLVDENEVRQMLLNFVQNGLDAMAPGGTLTIKLYTEEQYVVLAIQDEGSGIAPRLLEKLGTPFFTTKEQGTGLGLAVCYSIAARHNAKIKLETGDKGTTFFVQFSNNAKLGQRDIFSKTKG
jgi:two-component system, sporulation sensor kinase E